MNTMHKLLILKSFILFILVSNCLAESSKQYLERRKLFVEKERTQMLGSNITLTEEEQKVNRKLIEVKLLEYNESATGKPFLASIHFFKAKPWIETSEMFKIITKIPKGAALHLHDTSLVDVWWLVKEASYYDPDHLYMCVDHNNQLQFIFSQNKPKTNFRGKVPPGCDWELVKYIRGRFGAEIVDNWLHGNLTLIVDDPWHAYPTQQAVWHRFYSLFAAADGLIFYADVFKRYFIEAIHEFYTDNVQYLEFRALLPFVYELDGSMHDESWMMETYINISSEFSDKYPDFVGAKVIYSSIRANDSIKDPLSKAIYLRHKYPNHMLGYDLVGQEDPGHTLLYDMDTLLLPSQQGIDLPYFFHAGETNWEGLGVDENLIDAMLLNTTRIGHGYAITKHPEVMRVAKENGVAMEVCPISNQVLKLVDDLRNHPAATLITEDVPLVISADDPGLWGARGLSYDWYEAFMGLAGATADLRFLKQLAINSIEYSALGATEKQHLRTVWEGKWSQFIKETIANYRL